MVISKYNSEKIKVFNLLLIFLVLVIHGYYLEASDFPIAQALQKFAGNKGLSRVAIPLFFIISGFLFFNNVENIKHCFLKKKKRVWTLLIPYILWNILFVSWYVVLQSIPSIGGFINSEIVGDVLGGSFCSGLKALFWLPAGFHLWFLRDLLIYVLLSPILFYLIKHIKWISPVILLLIMATVKYREIYKLIDYNLYRIDGIVFFCIGGCISVLSSIDRMEKRLTKPVIIFSFIVYIGNAVWQIYGKDFNLFYDFATALCGCIAIWKCYDYVFKPSTINHKPSSINHELSPLAPYLGYSFFIYLFHEPTFNIIKKIGLKVLGVHEWSLILLYLVNPIIMCILAIAVAKLLQRFIPKIYSVLVGGR